MLIQFHRIAAVILVLLFMPSGTAQTSYPMLMSLSPVAVQVGQSSEHELESRYSMFGAYQVLTTGEGVTGEIITPMEPGKDGKEPSLTKIKIRFTATSEAMPGVRDFRIVGPTGASTLGQIVVVRDPVVVETAKNDTIEQAQEIAIPATVCGAIEKSEDVDFFRFALQEPRSLTFVCHAMRLQDKIHDLQTHADPIISIRNAKTGSTLAAADNNFAADPFLSVQLPAGEFVLEVRDVRYQGNRYWNYAIEISSRPFVSNVMPMLVAKGTESKLQLVGSNLPENAIVSWVAPESCAPEAIDVALPIHEQVTNPVPVVVTDLPLVVETDEANGTVSDAQAMSFPGAAAGCIEQEADSDCFVFEAKKGDRVTVEVIARRHWSGLDSVVRILNADGKSLTENDDGRLLGRLTVQDSIIENWAVPADGKYTVEVRDVHLRGGAEFVYGLKVLRAEPDFELVMDSDKSWLTPGTNAALFVRAVRKNGFTGPIELHVDGLPDGVTAACGIIQEGKGVDGCIILTADPAAVPLAANIRVRGTGQRVIEGQEPVELDVNAHSMQEIYMPGGGRNHWPVTMHTVAVGRPADLLDVKLNTYDIHLKPGESTTVDVEIVRSEGFDKNVTLDMLYQHLSSKFANTLPEGVTIDAKNSQTLLTGKNTKGAITLVAAGNAPAISRHQCCIMANVSINFVMKATYSSKPVLISVSE
ncbi:MAG: PPC domain-containing protein [Planctomycetaceae bacterium]